MTALTNRLPSRADFDKFLALVSDVPAVPGDSMTPSAGD